MTGNLAQCFKHIILARKIGILNKITNNIGNCEIVNDKVICKVNNDILIEGARQLPNYYLNLNGIEDDLKEEIKKLLGYTRSFKIVYIIKDMIFEKPLYLSSSLNTKVKFINCRFNKEIDILYGDEFIFEDCKYYDFEPIYYNGETYFNVSEAVNKVTFLNSNFTNPSDSANTLGMSINSKELSVSNSLIKPNDYASVYVDVDILNVNHAKFICKDMSINYKIINNVASEFIYEDEKVKRK